MRRSSRIVLADLAGFERISATGSVTDLRLREGGLTNKSLTMFGKCLNALSTRARSGSVLSRSRTGSVRKARKVCSHPSAPFSLAVFATSAALCPLLPLDSYLSDCVISHQTALSHTATRCSRGCSKSRSAATPRRL